MGLGNLERRAYDSRKREQQRHLANDIGEIPDIYNRQRREECEADPALWLRTYLPNVYFRTFTECQKEFLGLAWCAIINRTARNINAWRSFGKTCLLSGLVLRSLLMGAVKFAYYVTAESSSKDAFRFFETALSYPIGRSGKYTDDCPLAQDYPEVCYPITIRDGVAQRPLEYHGRPCLITISPSEIIFPSLDGYETSGSTLRFSSILAAKIRGAHHSIRGLGVIRPELVMIDDVQSDSSAKSDKEVDNIMGVIKNSIDGVPGYDRRTGKKASLAIFSAITQNQPNDVARRIIEELPHYCTVIYPFFKRPIPTNLDAWKRYREYRDQLYRKSEGVDVRDKLVQYYKINQQDIESGFVPNDPLSYEAWQVSAVHYALEKWCKSEKSYWCELMNDVQMSVETSGTDLTPSQVQYKHLPLPEGAVNTWGNPTTGYYQRCQVPKNTQILTAQIDVGKHYLAYQITAFGVDYRFAHVIDFGIWPDQEYPRITKKSYRVDLQDVYEEGDELDRIRDAIIDCLKHIFTQRYTDHNQETYNVDSATDYTQHAHPRGQQSRVFARLALCGVDCSDGTVEPAIWEAIDKFHAANNRKWEGRVMPMYGAESEYRLMRYYDLKRGEWRRGLRKAEAFDWIECPARNAEKLKKYNNIYASLTYDVNQYKTQRDSAWKTLANRPGAETIFEWPEQEYLCMYAEQQCAEEYTETRKSNMIYRRWKIKKPRFADNEFLDCDTACWALASYVGLERASEKSACKLKVNIIT